MRKGLLCLFFLIVCSLPPSSGFAMSASEGDDLISKAPVGKALVYLFTAAFINVPENGGGASKHKVAIDGQSLGRFGARKYVLLSLDPGVHTISKLFYNGFSWENLKSEFRAGEVYFVAGTGPSIEPRPVFIEREAALKKLTKSKYKHAGNYEFDRDLRGDITSVRKVENLDPVASQPAIAKSELITADSTLPAVEKPIREAPEGKALVYLFSPAFLDHLTISGADNKIRVAIDDVPLAKMKAREYIVFELTPDIHELSEQANEVPRTVLKGDFREGEVYFFETRVTDTGYNADPAPRAINRKKALKKIVKSKFKHTQSYTVQLDSQGEIVAFNDASQEALPLAAVPIVKAVGPNPSDPTEIASVPVIKKRESKPLAAVNTPPKIAPSAAKSAGSSGRAVVAAQVTPAKEQFKSNTHAIAVIIGNRNYQRENNDAPDVDFAINDAREIKKYVIDVLRFKEGNVIYHEDASQAAMVNLFGSERSYQGQLYDWVRPKLSDVFVFYSGHGAPSIRDGKGYLLPVDANPNRVELNGYSLETLYNNLAQIPAKSFTVVIDACFSGASQGGSIVKNASSISLKRVGTVASLPNSTILTAAGLSEVASWDGKAKHGLFTRYFLDGVRGEADGEGYGNRDGQVTLGELKGYLESEVTYQARRHYGRDQHPQVSGSEARVMAELK